jgi:hypothetical protein
MAFALEIEFTIESWAGIGGDVLKEATEYMDKKVGEL